ncbi:MAG: DUF166 domain-containing protein, partial [Candidatus Promineifilaceae bacterium]
DSWQTPRSLPIVLDYPEEYLPESFQPADLILSLAELPGVAEMIPDIAQMSGARAVIAPIDSQAWLPYGLARQLKGWLERDGVPCVYPMPFCSLTKSHFNALRLKEAYDNELIAEFARYFGRPAFDVTVDKTNKIMKQVEVIRDACCGCAHFAAERLVGANLTDSIQDVGLHHHHYPCQASMGIDPLFGDTLMHVSGNIMKDALKEALGPDLEIAFIKPAGYVEPENP